MALQIGKLIIENPLVTGPDGRCDGPAISSALQGAGAGLLCTEMISAKAIMYKNKNTKALMEINPKRAAGVAAAVWFGSVSDGADREADRRPTVRYSGYQYGLSGPQGGK